MYRQSRPAFADGAPIPEQYTCKGANIASVDPVGAAWRRTSLSMIRTHPANLTSIDRDRDRPLVLSTADGETPVAESACRTQRSARILSAPPAGGHRDTPLPVYPHHLPAVPPPRDWLGHKRRVIAQAATMQARLIEHTKADPPAIPRSSGLGDQGSPQQTPVTPAKSLD